MKKSDNIVLIGMPAVGKSTVGVLLAKRLGYAFLDTDVYIQSREGRRLSEIIEAEGLEAFCGIEESHVLTVRHRHHIIATGGSVVYGEKAMAHLGASGLIVHLDVSLSTLKKRLTDTVARGVVMAPGHTLDTLYEERHALYRKYADINIDCGTLSPDEVLDEIIGALP